jgi:adenylosuccinate lyase
MANTTTEAAALDLQSQISKMKSQTGGGNPIFDTYQTSLTGRYCSNEMSQLFSQRSRHSTWRKLWLYLAEAEKELGIETISDQAIEEMRANLMITDADFEVAKVEEKKRRHDVMAHVHAFGQVAPSAARIIHYGVCLLLPASGVTMDMAMLKRTAITCGGSTPSSPCLTHE